MTADELASMASLLSFPAPATTCRVPARGIDLVITGPLHRGQDGDALSLAAPITAGTGVRTLRIGSGELLGFASDFGLAVTGPDEPALIRVSIALMRAHQVQHSAAGNAGDCTAPDNSPSSRSTRARPGRLRATGYSADRLASVKNATASSDNSSLRPSNSAHAAVRCAATGKSSAGSIGSR